MTLWTEFICVLCEDDYPEAGETGQTFAPPPSPKPHKKHTHTHNTLPSLPASLTFAPPNPLLFFCCCIPLLPCSNLSLIEVALHANVWKDGALDAPTSKLILGWRFDLAISTASLSLLHPQFCGVLAAFRCACEGRIQPAQRAEAVAGPPRRRSKRLGCRLLGLECRGERVWSAGASAWSTLLCAEVNFDDALWLSRGDMATIMQDASSLAKKKEASRTWMLLDTKGESTLLEVDKYAIMHRVGIHARDLRILDPLLSYPSTILGRERAIVLNLEHIKAIITADEVLLRNPTDESVIPFVEELCRRLPLKANKNEGVGIEVDEDEIKDFEKDGNGVSWSPQRGDQDENVPGADASPFEFRALEVALEAICSFLDARTTELETAAYPALDELTKKISSRNLDRVRKLKSGMTRLNARVQKVRDELEQLLDDDDDMADLFLTRKMLGPQSPGASSSALVWAPPSPTIVSRNSRTSKANTVTSFAHGTATGADDVEELEMLLEAYFMQIDGTLNKLTTLREYIDDTEDYINIQLDNHRNQLIQLELILSSATVVVALYSLVAGIFGMNLPYSWNHDHSYVFKWVVLVTGTVCTIIFGAVLGYARYKHLIGT